MVRFERQPPGTAITRMTLSVGALLAALAAWLVVARRAGAGRCRGARIGHPAPAAVATGRTTERAVPPTACSTSCSTGCGTARSWASIAWVARTERPEPGDRGPRGALRERALVLRPRSRRVPRLQRGGEPCDEGPALRLGRGGSRLRPGGWVLWVAVAVSAPRRRGAHVPGRPRGAWMSVERPGDPARDDRVPRLPLGGVARPRAAGRHGRRLFRLGGRLAFELAPASRAVVAPQPGAGAGSRSRRSDRA